MFIAVTANLIGETAFHLLNPDDLGMSKDGRRVDDQSKSTKHPMKKDDSEKWRYDDDPFKEINEAWIKYHRPFRFEGEKGRKRGIRVLAGAE